MHLHSPPMYLRRGSTTGGELPSATIIDFSRFSHTHLGSSRSMTKKIRNKNILVLESSGFSIDVAQNIRICVPVLRGLLYVRNRNRNCFRTYDYRPLERSDWLKKVGFDFALHKSSLPFSMLCKVFNRNQHSLVFICCSVHE